MYIHVIERYKLIVKVNSEEDSVQKGSRSPISKVSVGAASPALNAKLHDVLESWEKSKAEDEDKDN